MSDALSDWRPNESKVALEGLLEELSAGDSGDGSFCLCTRFVLYEGVSLVAQHITQSAAVGRNHPRIISVFPEHSKLLSRNTGYFTRLPREAEGPSATIGHFERIGGIGGN